MPRPHQVKCLERRPRLPTKEDNSPPFTVPNAVFSLPTVPQHIYQVPTPVSSLATCSSQHPWLVHDAGPVTFQELQPSRLPPLGAVCTLPQPHAPNKANGQSHIKAFEVPTACWVNSKHQLNTLLIEYLCSAHSPVHIGIGGEGLYSQHQQGHAQLHNE